MRTLLLLLVSTTLSHAHLIDLTPGGYTDPNQFPLVQRFLQQQTFFDQAVHNFPGRPDGWISEFGRINGGEFFDTNLFTLGDTPFASVSWNFLSQPDHFWMTLISVYGVNEEGEIVSHIFGVTHNQLFVNLGELVSVDNFTNIMSISFYGRNVAPDTGSTILLALISLLILTSTRYFQRDTLA